MCSSAQTYPRINTKRRFAPGTGAIAAMTPGLAQDLTPGSGDTPRPQEGTFLNPNNQLGKIKATPTNHVCNLNNINLIPQFGFNRLGTTPPSHAPTQNLDTRGGATTNKHQSTCNHFYRTTFQPNLPSSWCQPLEHVAKSLVVPDLWSF